MLSSISFASNKDFIYIYNKLGLFSLGVGRLIASGSLASLMVRPIIYEIYVFLPA